MFPLLQSEANTATIAFITEYRSIFFTGKKWQAISYLLICIIKYDWIQNPFYEDITSSREFLL